MSIFEKYKPASIKKSPSKNVSIDFSKYNITRNNQAQTQTKELDIHKTSIKDGIKTFTMPQHLGGGQYKSRVGFPNEIIKSPRGYGSFEHLKGSEIDHKIPVSLGGTSKDPNLHYLKTKWKPLDFLRSPFEKKGRQEGKVLVEMSAIKDYKAGKITLGQARQRVLTWDKQPEPLYKIWFNEIKDEMSVVNQVKKDLKLGKKVFTKILPDLFNSHNSFELWRKLLNAKSPENAMRFKVGEGLQNKSLVTKQKLEFGLSPDKDIPANIINQADVAKFHLSTQMVKGDKEPQRYSDMLKTMAIELSSPLSEKVLTEKETRHIFGRAIVSSALRATQGFKGADILNENFGDKYIKKTQKEIKEINKKNPQIANFMESMSYSLAIQAPSLAAAFLSKFLPIPGLPELVGGTVSFELAKRMTENQITEQYLYMKDEEMMNKKGRHINEQEQKLYKNEFNKYAKKYGLWEAVPEALGNVVGFKLLTKPLSKIPGGNKFITRLGLDLALETGTETITQLGQEKIQYDVQMPGGRNINWNNPDDWMQALYTVAPITIAISLVSGGAVGIINQLHMLATETIGQNPALIKNFKIKLIELNKNTKNVLRQAKQSQEGFAKIPGKNKESNPKIDELGVKIKEIEKAMSNTTNKIKLKQLDKAYLAVIKERQSILNEDPHYQEARKALRGAKGKSAEDIMKEYPNIQLKRDVPAKDIHGNKVKIPEGEALTPYELKGNKVLLQDGQTYIVSKNQFQNIKGEAPVIKTSGKMFEETRKETLIAEIQKAKQEGKSFDEFVKNIFDKKLENSMSHRPTWEGSPPASNLLEGDMLPRDVYEHPDWSIASGRISGKEKSANESWEVLKSIRNKPNTEITIYRSAPKKELRIGDWVSLSKNYAKEEGIHPTNSKLDLPVYSFKVKAKDVLFAGDDINEFGYYPKSQLRELWDKKSGKMFEEVKSADYKRNKNEFIGGKISGEQAVINAKKLLKKLKISGVDEDVLNKILTGDGGEAFASSWGSEILFTDVVSTFAAEHEVGHTYFRTLPKTEQKAILSKMRELYPNIKTDYSLNEQLMINLEHYLNTRKTNTKFRGKILNFFRKVLGFLRRVFKPKNLDVIRNFYETIENGRKIFAKEIKIKKLKSNVLTDKNGHRYVDYKNIKAKFQKIGYSQEEINDIMSNIDAELKADNIDQDIISKIKEYGLMSPTKDIRKGTQLKESEEMTELRKTAPSLFKKDAMGVDEMIDKLREDGYDISDESQLAQEIKKAQAIRNKDNVREVVKNRIREKNKAITNYNRKVLNNEPIIPPEFTKYIPVSGNITQASLKIFNKNVNALPNVLKERVVDVELPPSSKVNRAFGLLNNKATSVAFFENLYNNWVTNGVKVIIEPYSGAFTIGANSMRSAFMSGLEEYHTNIFDKEKYLIIDAIKKGKIEDIKGYIKDSVKALDHRIIKIAKQSEPTVYKVLSAFKKAHPDSYIGSNVFKQYMKNTGWNAKIKNYTSEYNKFARVFGAAYKELGNIKVSGLKTATLLAVLERTGVFSKASQKLISKAGFNSIETALFEKYGMIAGLEDIENSFNLARENKVKVNIYGPQYDGVDMINKIVKNNKYKPEEIGVYSDPPYVKSSAVYSKKTKSNELDKYSSGKSFVKSHKTLFDLEKNGGKLAFTNDIDQEYVYEVMNALSRQPGKFFAYREGNTPTSLIITDESFNVADDFFALGKDGYTRLSKWQDLEYLTKTIRRGGYTAKVIERLKANGVTQEVIDQLKIDDKYFTKLIKVKIESNGVVSTTISKKQLDYLRKTSKIKELDDKYLDTVKFKNKVIDTKNNFIDLIQGYETGARFFFRIGNGFKNMLFDPIRAGERMAAQESLYIKKRLLKSVFSKLHGISKKEAEMITKYSRKKQGRGDSAIRWSDLSPRAKRAYIDSRNLVDKMYYKVRDVANKNGRVVNKVNNYLPLYTRDTIKTIDKGGLTFIRKDPFFGSLIEREEYTNDLYEKDFRVVMEAWVDGVTRYVNIGSRTLPIKYMIDSQEFADLTGPKVNTLVHNWYNHIVEGNQARPWHKSLKAIRMLEAIGILGLKLTTILKQGLNILDATALMPAHRILKNALKVGSKSYIAKNARLSGSIVERTLGFEIMDLTSKIVEYTAAPALHADKLTAKIIWMSTFESLILNQKKSGGVLDAKSYRTFSRFSDDIVDAIMGATSMSEKPEYFRGEVGKAINMFMSQVNSKMQFYITDIWNDPKFKELSDVSHNRNRSRVEFLSYAMLMLVLGGYIEKIITDLYFDDNWEDASKDIIYQIAGNFPLLGPALYAIKTGQQFAISPISSNIFTLFRYITEGKPVNAAWQAAGLVGFPRQLTNIINGASVIKDGGVYDNQGNLLFKIEDPLERTRTLIKGKYGSKAARDYFNKNKPTKAGKDAYKKAQKLIDSGKKDEAQKFIDSLSDKEYKDYLKILKKERKKKDAKITKEVNIKYLKIEKLVKNGKRDEAQRLLNSLSDKEYKIYLKILKKNKSNTD